MNTNKHLYVTYSTNEYDSINHTYQPLSQELLEQLKTNSAINDSLIFDLKRNTIYAQGYEFGGKNAVFDRVNSGTRISSTVSNLAGNTNPIITGFYQNEYGEISYTYQYVTTTFFASKIENPNALSYLSGLSINGSTISYQYSPIWHSTRHAEILYGIRGIGQQNEYIFGDSSDNLYFPENLFQENLSKSSISKEELVYAKLDKENQTITIYNFDDNGSEFQELLSQLIDHYDPLTDPVLDIKLKFDGSDYYVYLILSTTIYVYSIGSKSFQFICTYEPLREYKFFSIDPFVTWDLKSCYAVFDFGNLTFSFGNTLPYFATAINYPLDLLKYQEEYILWAQQGILYGAIPGKTDMQIEILYSANVIINDFYIVGSGISINKFIIHTKSNRTNLNFINSKNISVWTAILDNSDFSSETVRIKYVNCILQPKTGNYYGEVFIYDNLTKNLGIFTFDGARTTINIVAQVKDIHIYRSGQIIIEYTNNSSKWFADFSSLYTFLNGGKPSIADLQDVSNIIWFDEINGVVYFLPNASSGVVSNVFLTRGGELIYSTTNLEMNIGEPDSLDPISTLDLEGPIPVVTGISQTSIGQLSYSYLPIIVEHDTEAVNFRDNGVIDYVNLTTNGVLLYHVSQLTCNSGTSQPMTKNKSLANSQKTSLATDLAYTLVLSNISQDEYGHISYSYSLIYNDPKDYPYHTFGIGITNSTNPTEDFVDAIYKLDVTNDQQLSTSHILSYYTYSIPTKNYVDKAFKANDALRYCGIYVSSSTIGTIGTFTHLATGPGHDQNDNAIGAVYKVSTAGYFGIQYVVPGDMIISYQDTHTNGQGWNVINENINLRTSNPIEALDESNVLTGVKMYGDGTLSYTYSSLELSTFSNVVSTGMVAANNVQNISGMVNDKGFKVITGISMTKTGLTTNFSYTYSYIFAEKSTYFRKRTNAKIYISGSINSAGELSSYSYIDGSTYIKNGELYVPGNFTVKGNSFVGDAPSDQINIKAKIVDFNSTGGNFDFIGLKALWGDIQI